MFSVPSALTWPALGMPTIMPNCCCTAGSEAVASMRPYSSGGPLYLSRSGRTVEAFDRFGREAQRRARAHRAGRLRNRRAVFGDEHARHAVEAAHALEIVLHHRDAGGRFRFDRRHAVRRSSPLRDGTARPVQEAPSSLPALSWILEAILSRWRTSHADFSPARSLLSLPGSGLRGNGPVVAESTDPAHRTDRTGRGDGHHGASPGRRHHAKGRAAGDRREHARGFRHRRASGSRARRA